VIEFVEIPHKMLYFVLKGECKMTGLLKLLCIVERELDYQKRVYKGKTKRYQELLRKREIIETMITLMKNS